MTLKLYNTLTKQKETFKSIEDKQVGMYNCGPTVYDYVHIGNLRSYVFADILRRTLEWNGHAVRQVVNITDFGHLTSDADAGEDKMMKGLKREGKPLTLSAMRELADFYAEKFKEDIAALNIKTPTVLPFASEHISEQIDIIKGLEEKRFTYTTSDGVYFDTARDANYGKLGGLSEISEQQARVEHNSEKREPRDFALWKLSPSAHKGADGARKHAEQTPVVEQSSLRSTARNNAENIIGWDSPWGKGFPGWHLECSAMSLKYLTDVFEGDTSRGERSRTIDIHTGGVDHIATHHNNEIAQSENFTGEPFVNYWLHNEFITLDKDKMAKSAGGFITRRDLEAKGFDPLSYRYWLLTAHYRSPVDFSWDALASAQSALHKLKERIAAFEESADKADAHYTKRFSEAVNDDLNTPQALAVVWDMLKDGTVAGGVKKATLLVFDSVLGLRLGEEEKVVVPADVQQLVEEREDARVRRDWDAADALRRKIESRGYSIKDTDNGPAVQKK